MACNWNGITSRTRTGRIALSMALLAVAAQSALARPEKNAYLNRPAESVAQLVHQAETDREVMDRYMRHFAMDRRQVLALLKGLHVSRLKQSTRFEMYSVPDGGVLKMHRCTLHRGERVFVDRNGQPVLRLKCGNPLTLGPQHPSMDQPHVSDAAPFQATEDDQVQPVFLATTIEPSPVAEIPAPVVDETPEVSAPEPFSPEPPTRPMQFASSLGGILGGITALATIPITLGSPPPTSFPVPEPSTVLALGCLVPLALLRRRK